MTFEHPVRVYWEDTDAGGIVFYANYLKFFERARTEWLRHLGFGQRALADQCGGLFVVAAAELKYHLPARLDDELIVTCHLESAGRAGLKLAQQAFLKQSDSAPRTLLCAGTIRVGWVDAATLRPARMPPGVLHTLESVS